MFSNNKQQTTGGLLEGETYNTYTRTYVSQLRADLLSKSSQEKVELLNKVRDKAVAQNLTNESSELVLYIDTLIVEISKTEEPNGINRTSIEGKN